MTVAVLLQSVDSKELSEWQAFYKIVDEKQEEHKREMEQRGTDAKAVEAVYKATSAQKAKKR